MPMCSLCGHGHIGPCVQDGIAQNAPSFEVTLTDEQSSALLDWLAKPRIGVVVIPKDKT
jgi:hypothetical protein